MIRKRFTYANVAMTLALVFAMSGGAYAAKHYLITSTKQISPKVLKALKGAKGAKGANGANGAAGLAGPAGPAGPGGPAGPAGAAGAKGETGSQGTPGTPGKNGEKGAAGSPWTAGGTLPKNATETGQWVEAIGIDYKQLQLSFVSISFPIPLATELEASMVHFIKPTEAVPTGCKGTPAKPEAESGNLCIFASTYTENTLSGPTFINASGGTGTAGTTGTVMQFQTSAATEGGAFARGTFATTG
jgi:hypothetical protein